nr:rRNA 2'-O-methyltransferase fibrillarin-like [Dermacentor andersoni]
MTRGGRGVLKDAERRGGDATLRKVVDSGFGVAEYDTGRGSGNGERNSCFLGGSGGGGRYSGNGQGSKCMGSGGKGASKAESQRAVVFLGKPTAVQGVIRLPEVQEATISRVGVRRGGDGGGDRGNILKQGGGPLRKV